jgi:hypothetical protein
MNSEYDKTMQERPVDPATLATVRSNQDAGAHAIDITGGDPGGHLATPSQVFNLPMKPPPPRDEVAIRHKIAAAANAAGEAWFYRFPVNDKGSQSWIQGPSVKLANYIARVYGNSSLGVIHTLDVGHSWIFTVAFVDHETGYQYMRDFEQSKTGAKLGGKDDNRRREISFQIGQSKAIRNVVVNVLGDLCDFGLDIAKANLVERIGKNLEGSRQKIVEKLYDLQIPQVRVERIVGKPAGQWLAQDIARVVSEVQAVEEGLADPAQIWPDEQSLGARPARTKTEKDDRPQYDLADDAGEIVSVHNDMIEYLDALAELVTDPERDCDAVWSANHDVLAIIAKQRRKAIKDKLGEVTELFESAREPVGHSSDDGAQLGSGESVSSPTPAAASDEPPQEMSKYATYDNDQWGIAANQWNQKIQNCKTEDSLGNVEASIGEFLQAAAAAGRDQTVELLTKIMNGKRDSLSNP